MMTILRSSLLLATVLSSDATDAGRKSCDVAPNFRCRADTFAARKTFALMCKCSPQYIGYDKMGNYAADCFDEPCVHTSDCFKLLAWMDSAEYSDDENCVDYIACAHYLLQTLRKTRPKAPLTVSEALRNTSFWSPIIPPEPDPVCMHFEDLYSSSIPNMGMAKTVHVTKFNFIGFVVVPMLVLISLAFYRTHKTFVREEARVSQESSVAIFAGDDGII